MAYRIVTAQCTGCTACEAECPNGAIYENASGLFAIDADKCTECVGYYDSAQCVAVCPVDGTCVLDASHPRFAAA